MMREHDTGKPLESGDLLGDSVVPGTATGEVLYSAEAISMMGGVDPLTGVVIDTHHPLHGQCVAGKVLVIPGGRGSCAGSGALFEMLLAGTAPAALVFCRAETILTIGAVIAEEFFNRTLPIVRVSPSDHESLATIEQVTVIDGAVIPGTVADARHTTVALRGRTRDDERFVSSGPSEIRLSGFDERMLLGDFGEAAQAAMRVVVKAAQVEGAGELIDIEMAHIDGNFYQGPASLAFGERLVELGARVRVPSTMNSLKVDRKQWRAQGVSADLGEPSEALADAYLAMGVKETYTCAPYWLEEAPKFGEQIVWAESNAVVFANSVLGARTLKYPDYLDILVAITGRAPAAGTHLPRPRRATLRIDVEPLTGTDDSLFPLLGYLVGKIATYEVPVICGLERSGASRDDLRAFGAALATTSAAPMFHMVGITPEAATLEEAVGGDASEVPTVTVTREDLRRTRAELNTAEGAEVDLVSFGNPHFSLTEIERLAGLCDGIALGKGVSLMITCGREIHRRAVEHGFVARIEAVGGRFITDTCWCLIQAPVISSSANVMTNSAKYAHYGPAQVGRGMRFGSFEECMAAARSGRAPVADPEWLLN